MDNAQGSIALIIIVFVLMTLISLAIVVVASHFVARAARMKNRSYASFFWLSILFSPLTTGLIVAILPFNLDDPRHPKNKPASTGLASFASK